MGDFFLDGQRREPICEPHDGGVLEMEKKMVYLMSRRAGVLVEIVRTSSPLV